MLEFDRKYLYCDECGEKITATHYWIDELQMDITSANAGESAVLDKKCFAKYAAVVERHPDYSDYVKED